MDIIADMISSMKNALLRGNSSVSVHRSKLAMEVLRILQEEG